MSRSQPRPITRIRESLGFTLEEVAAQAGWAPARLRQIEQMDDIDDSDARSLADILGVDIVQALGDPAVTALSPPAVRALLKSKADVLDAGSRFAIAEASGVATETVALRRALGEDVGWKYIRGFRHASDYSHPSRGTPAVLAGQVRRRLELGDGPVVSVLRDVLLRLRIQVIVTEMNEVIDAVSFATARTGGAIVLNKNGAHTRTAFGRRVTLAHEVCHILFDRPKMREFNEFCVVARPRKRPSARREASFEEVERRARAFAVYLLAPLDEFAAVWRDLDGLPPPRRVRLMMERFGLGYEAVRSHLENANLLGMRKKMGEVDTETPSAWNDRDPLPVHVADALAAVPLPRRGELLRLALRAWHANVLAESGVRDLLRVTLAEWPAVREHLRAGQDMTNLWATSCAALGPPAVSRRLESN